MRFLFWRKKNDNDCNLQAVIEWLKSIGHDRASEDLMRLKQEYEMLQRQSKSRK